MKTIDIQNFKYGLDTRRSVLSSQLGTLVTLENAFVNQGAEIEQRKAFVKVGSIPLGALQPTYDLLATTSGLVTFGSYSFTRTDTFRARSANVATLTLQSIAGYPTVVPYRIGDVVNISGVGGTGYNGNNIVITNVSGLSIQYASTGSNEATTADTTGTITLVSFSGLVKYQQLIHPLQTQIATFLIPMSGVSTSCSFNGQAFVSATFSAVADASSTYLTNGGTVWFSNGISVIPSYLGVIQVESFTGSYSDQLPVLATELANSINYYFGTTFTGTFVVPSYTTLTGPVAVAFTTTASQNSVYGTFTQDTRYGAKAQNATNPVAATTTFYLVSGASGSINSVVDYNSVALIPSAVNFDVSLYQTAIDLANKINANTGTSGYTAVANLITTKVAGVTITGPTSVAAASINTQLLTVNSTTIHVASTATGAGGTGATTYAFAGAVDGVAATSQINYLLFYINNGTKEWTYGETWTLNVTYNNVIYTLGAGNVAGLTPTFSLPLGNRVNVVSGTKWLFSKVSDATRWENQDAGAGFVTITDQASNPSNVLALSSYQGKIAVFCPSTIVIWNLNADPTQQSIFQTLTNIGTIAGGSVQALGTYDALFLSNSGVRSLRAQIATLSANVVDVGSPIDALITKAILAGGTVLSVVEPTTQTYWLYINGTIYNFSKYDELKIEAWSTFTPTYITNFGNPGSTNYTYNGLTVGWKYYVVKGSDFISVSQGGQPVSLNPDGSFVSTATTLVMQSSNGGTLQSVLYEATQFTPAKFVVSSNQVFVLDTVGNIYQYGGTNGTTYDGSVVTVTTPWLDDKHPNLNKGFQMVDIGIQGAWTLLAGCDPYSSAGASISQYLEVIAQTGSAAQPNVVTDSTFDKQTIGYIANGTHFQLMAISNVQDVGPVKLTNLLISYEPQDLK